MRQYDCNDCGADCELTVDDDEKIPVACPFGTKGWKELVNWREQ